MVKENKRFVWVVMDGWGIAPAGKGNCISQAKTPNFDSWIKEYPHSILNASGNAVGLPKGYQGNSEVGHLHMGAGRIVWQSFELINRSIKDGSFFKNKAFLGAIENCKKNKTALHLMGLCSDEGVHATTTHLFALLDLCKKKKFKRVFVHCFLDGRDVPEKSAPKYIASVEKKLKETGVGRIASICGRYYAMDRAKYWVRTEKAYNLLMLGEGFRADTALKGLKMAYKRGDLTDYYVQPTAIVPKNEPGPVVIGEKDSVLFYNFRIDRPKQLSHALVDKNFDKFERKVWPKIHYVTMTDYEEEIKSKVAFRFSEIKNNLADVLSKNNYKQMRIAEKEKSAHVTYFFNSQKPLPVKGEERSILPTADVDVFSKKPEMSAPEIAEEAVKQINKEKYDFILINFANCDVVGHSAVIPAIIKAVETVDFCTQKVVMAALAKNYTIIITADHGSAEEKFYKNGSPKPAHSSNPVNFILVSNNSELKKAKLKNGGLSDLAPTLLKIAGLKQPKEMTGKPLI